MKSKWPFLIAFFFVAAHGVFAQTANNLDGNWSYENSDTHEVLGYFNFSSTLTIRGEHYMVYQERISEHGAHWDYCQIGRIVITGNEIQLYPEAWCGHIDWHKATAQDRTRYRYVLNGNDLVMMQDNNTEVYRKSSELGRNQLLIYSGTMSGTQTLNIKLVIGNFDHVYYMYIRNGNQGDPICLVYNDMQNGVLMLGEPDENYEDRASMIFFNFNPNENTITGVWEDVRPGRTANKYDVKLSKRTE